MLSANIYWFPNIHRFVNFLKVSVLFAWKIETALELIVLCALIIAVIDAMRWQREDEKKEDKSCIIYVGILELEQMVLTGIASS